MEDAQIVHEPILKKAKKREFLAKSSEDAKQKHRVAQRKEQRKKRVGKIIDYTTPQSIVKDYRERQKSYTIYKRSKHKLEKGGDYDLPNGAIIFVVRIKAGKHSAVQVNKILNKMKLYMKYMGAFVKITDHTRDMLKEVTPYVTYGIPSRDTISNLLYKRGHLKLGEKVENLKSNQIVEELLGDKGLICVEDLVHSLSTGDKHTTRVISALCSFKLSQPKEGVLKQNRKPFGKGGDYGNRGSTINELIDKMI